ncbi:hypothetical protein ACLKA7_001905 [Drosophila subpalustris]
MDRSDLVVSPALNQASGRQGGALADKGTATVCEPIFWPRRPPGWCLHGDDWQQPTRQARTYLGDTVARKTPQNTCRGETRPAAFTFTHFVLALVTRWTSERDFLDKHS